MTWLLVMLGSASAGTGCDWVDGSDPAAPSDDGGRGISDWTQHSNWAVGNAAGTPDLVARRFGALKTCLPGDGAARLYADVSILVGHYGRTHAGWVDGVDPKAPPQDSGRGIRAWQAHRDWAAGPSAATAGTLVGERLRTLKTTLPPAVYQRLYADVSIVLANYGRMH